MRHALPLLLLTACVCPRPLCAQWLHVRVASDTWPVGTVRVDVAAGEARVACDLVVTDPTRAPRPAEITCGPGVLKDDFQLDTAGSESGGSGDPGVVELRALTGRGTALPPTAAVRVTFDDGTGPVLVTSDTVTLVWSSHPPMASTCSTGCADATLELAPTP